MTMNESFDRGMRTRREVLGDEYVDRATANADDFSKPLQEIVAEYCWDRIWNRPGLPRKTRSLLNIAMIAVLNRPHELRLHVAGALRNGCTQAEIREALLQVTIYAGVPAGVDGFRIAREVLEKELPE